MHSLRPARLARNILSLGALSALSCASESTADADCRRYKAALLAESFDTEYTTPPVDGSYDAYRCPSAAEFVPQGAYASLSACAEYLERLDGQAPLTGRSLCKLGVLIWEDRGAHTSSASVGSACTLNFVNPRKPDEAPHLEWPEPACREAHVCVSATTPPSAEGYCTCRCDADGVDLPVCACPSGYACVPDAIPIRGDGVRGGYCLRR